MVIMSSFSIPISLFRQYTFCPRVVWYQLNLNAGVKRPLWVEQGLEYHDRQGQLDKSRSLRRYDISGDHIERLYGKTVSCNEPPMHGITDLLLVGETSIYPVEFKLSKPRKLAGLKLQLAAYGMAAEQETGKDCHKAFLIYGDRAKTIDFTIDEKVRSEVRDAAHQVSLIAKNDRIPDSSASLAQCQQCEYLLRCNDRF